MKAKERAREIVDELEVGRGGFNERENVLYVLSHIDAAVAAEREACAVEADAFWMKRGQGKSEWSQGVNYAGTNIAAAIRAGAD